MSSVSFSLQNLVILEVKERTINQPSARHGDFCSKRLVPAVTSGPTCDTARSTASCLVGASFPSSLISGTGEGFGLRQFIALIRRGTKFVRVVGLPWLFILSISPAFFF
jgi:hypothetical protein